MPQKLQDFLAEAGIHGDQETIGDIKIEKLGRRIYISGDTFKIKEKLQSLGCKGEKIDGKFMWYVGSEKEHTIRELVRAYTAGEIEGEEEVTKVIGKARYKDRVYYLRWYGETEKGEKAHLCTLDEKIDFWANLENVKFTKLYRKPKTLVSIRGYLAQEKKKEDKSRYYCAKCGRPGVLEEDKDGEMKHRSCFKPVRKPRKGKK